MIVDASAVLELLLATRAGAVVERHLRAADHRMAPELIDVEVLHALGRLVATTELSDADGRVAVRRLTRLPITRIPHAPLLNDAWRLRDNLSAYDAIYVALARATNLSLLTLDRRIAGAPGLGASITLVSV